MHIVFLDEFGHIGPFVSRHHDRYKTSPVFGLAGYIMPANRVRSFGTWFHQLKLQIFAEDIAASDHHPATWEKKGNELFTRGRVYKTKRIMNSLIAQIRKERGKIFYHGIQKHQSPEDSNPVGLYYTVLSHAISNLDHVFANIGGQYLIILDEHQSRLALLESAMRAMYGEHPARRLAQAPFQAESHLYPTVQAADWISTIIGTMWAHRALIEEYEDHEWAERYFGARIEAAKSSHCSVQLRTPTNQRRLPMRHPR